MPAAMVAGAPTYYSFPAILASRMPLALGRDVIGLAPGEATLATALHNAGYATAAFTAANPYLSPRFGYDQGFDVFEDFHEFEAGSNQAVGHSDLPAIASWRTKVNESLRKTAQAIGLGTLYNELYFQYRVRIATASSADMDALRRFPDANLLVDHAARWIDSIGMKPFFLWLHFMDPHSPYYPSPEAFRQICGHEPSAKYARVLNEFWNRSDLKPAQFARKKEQVTQLYDAGIRSVDNQLARLVSGLKHTHRWDTCAFVVTADHGEEFLDHGRRYHAPVNLYDEIARVPLMIRVPGTTKKKLSNSPFSHLHLAPTLLASLDVPIPEGFAGKSLWKQLCQEMLWEMPAVAECIPACTNPFLAGSRDGPRLLSVRDKRYKLVVQIEPAAPEQLFDLEADPREKQPIAESSGKQDRTRLLQVAREHLRKTVSRKDKMARLRAQLQDLRVELRENRR